MHSRIKVVLVGLVSAVAVNIVLAACTASSGSGGPADAGFLDAFLDSFVAPQDAKADTIPVSGQLDTATEPCNKASDEGGGYFVYYAEHTYVGATTDAIVARLHVYHEGATTAGKGGIAGYPTSFFSGLSFQVKADGTVAAICGEGLGPTPPGGSAHFIFQK